MRAYDQGAHVRVAVSAADVHNFNRRWPANGIEDKGYSFTFALNGDLVDTLAPEADDEAAFSALAGDAQEYARQRGLLT